MMWMAREIDLTRGNVLPSLVRLGLSAGACLSMIVEPSNDFIR
jgi:hypothetical protein